MVSQGEHVPGIAASYGFFDFHTIWNHPNNAELKSQRENPNVLFPGDELFIPDREVMEYSRPTDKKHQFVRKQPVLKLRMILRDQYENPVADTACLLIIESNSHRVTTDGDGKVELEIPHSARECSLVIQNEQETPHGGVTIPIKIGSLDPVDEVSGQQGRLSRLAYYAGPIDGNDSQDFQSALEEFQCENDLTVDGICGKKTQAKLKQVCGC